MGFQVTLVVKKYLPVNEGDIRDVGLSPRLENSERGMVTHSAFLPENRMDRGAYGYSPQDCRRGTRLKRLYKQQLLYSVCCAIYPCRVRIIVVLLNPLYLCCLLLFRSPGHH